PSQLTAPLAAPDHEVSNRRIIQDSLNAHELAVHITNNKLYPLLNENIPVINSLPLVQKSQNPFTQSALSDQPHNVKKILDAALFTINTNFWLGHATIQFTQKKKPIIQTEQLHLACKLIKIDFLIAQNLLILHVEIPLSDKTSYQKYKIDTVPVFIGNSSDEVLIKPVDDYIDIQKPRSFVHFFLSQHEISKCIVRHQTYLGLTPARIETSLTIFPEQDYLTLNWR
ncbi:hypothetical protein TSAR_011478, partial [Trichomalopsis sarcophagae]